jgi:hypothetical protein
MFLGPYEVYSLRRNKLTYYKDGRLEEHQLPGRYHQWDYALLIDDMSTFSRREFFNPFGSEYNREGIVIYAPDMKLHHVEAIARKYSIRDGQGMSVVEQIDFDGWYRIARPSFEEDLYHCGLEFYEEGYDVFYADRNGNQGAPVKY